MSPSHTTHFGCVGWHAPRVCRWLMAAGKRPVPFRTRKLSPPAPMVLHSGGCGRVGYRRPNNFIYDAFRTLGQCVRSASLFSYPGGYWNHRVTSPHRTSVMPGRCKPVATTFPPHRRIIAHGMRCHTGVCGRGRHPAPGGRNHLVTRPHHKSVMPGRCKPVATSFQPHHPTPTTGGFGCTRWHGRGRRRCRARRLLPTNFAATFT